MQATRWIPRTTLLGLALLAGACGGGDHIEGGLDDGFVYLIYDFDGDGEYETEFTFER